MAGSVAFGWLVSFAAAQTNGIFADFSTAAGTFTVELDYVRAPRTVAHFIRLAEGAQTWRDPVNGTARTGSWYAASAFHRIQYSLPAAGTTNRLALQGGLRAVDEAWSGKPGYAILDEPLNGLSHSNGTVALVTDGPHAGAAEFMILLTNGASFWDGLQTVFGRVSAGIATVQAIAGSGQTDGILHVPAAISNVVIRRVGAAAEAFPAVRSDLPAVQADECRVEMLTGGQARYVYAKGPQSETFMGHSQDLLDPQWTLYSFGFNGTTQAVDAAATFSTTPAGWARHYFHGVRVSYPVFSAIPLDQMAGVTFAAQWSDGTVYQYWLNPAAKTGMWQNVTTTGAYVRIGPDPLMTCATRGANTTVLNFMDQYGNIFDYKLGFDANGATTGRFYLEISGLAEGREWGTCQYAPWNPGAKSKAGAVASDGVRPDPCTETGPVTPRGIRFQTP